jgi:methyltransferase (TIGR00027 family)
MLWAWDRAILPGLALHFALRKLAIESAVRDAIASGAHRVIVLGAGFDSLALRLSREGVSCVEVDHPDTQRLKLAAIGRAGSSHLPVFIGADLAGGLPPGVLAGPDPVVIIAEGLLMYMPPARVEGLLHELATAPSGSRLVFTFFEPRPDDSLGFRRSSGVVNKWLRRRGEPFLWGEPAAGVCALLSRSGWEAVSIINSDGLRAGALGGAPDSEPLAVGECVGIARLHAPDFATSPG